MIRTVLYAVYIGLFLLTTPIAFIPYAVMKLFGRGDRAREYIGRAARFYARHVILSAGGRVTVSGLENLPPSQNLCVISNHQGLMDIPVLIGWLPFTAGFIAKKELGKVPILRMWMNGLRCIYLDRKNVRSGLDVILKGASYIETGHPMIIFPEGTRSRSETMGEFKAGSLKLATKAKAVIVPVTIRNAYRLFENTGRITPTAITLQIHSPIRTEELDKERQKELPALIGGIIREGLTA